MMILLSIAIVLWSFLEATFWWVAPDISISIAYVHFPSYWKRFVGFALLGALLGSLVTYVWAMYTPTTWLQYVGEMPFHSQKNIAYVRDAINADFFSIIKGAWGGIPYKLFFGMAPMQNVALLPLILIGLISRSIRFLVVMAVTWCIRFLSQPWSTQHPTKLSAILLLIWAISIATVDVVINKVFV